MLAASIQEEIKAGKKYKFDEITQLQIGNPQAFGQKPITFNRNVLSSLLDPTIAQYQSLDVQRRVKFYKESIGFEIGAYSQSPGYPVIREVVANFIQKRDRTINKPQINDIILTDGASSGIILLFNLLLNKNDGVMIPIPQYPLYSSVITLCGAQQIPYYLIEENNWSAEQSELEQSYERAKQKGINPKILVCINPGNPTGQVFDRQSIVQMIKDLLLRRKQQFQQMKYIKKMFMMKIYSLFHLEKLHMNSIQMLKYIQYIQYLKEQQVNVDQEVDIQKQLQKLILKFIFKYINQRVFVILAVMLCSNTIGQIMTGLMLTPPTIQEGCLANTVQVYKDECTAIFSSLQKRAIIVTQYLNQTKGISCSPIQGAMYACPKIELSEKYIQFAKKSGQEPDELYCIDLLKETGLVLVPGSGFQQFPGTYHFRMTILILPEETLFTKMKVFQQWHENYMSKFY